MEAVREYEEFYLAGLITGRELDLVLEAYISQRENRPTPWIRRLSYGAFDLNSMKDQDVYLAFRFHREGIPRLIQPFVIPDVVCIPESGYKIPDLTAMCIVLRRLSYPNRLSDLEAIFGYSGATLGTIANCMIRHMDYLKGHLLQGLSNLRWLTHERLEYYSAAVAAKG